MHRILLIILLLGSGMTSGCSGITSGRQRIVGSGNIISETRLATGFTSIVLESPADIRVSYGSTESVVVKGGDNIVPLIETNIENARLVIKVKADATYKTTQPVQVDITVISLEGIINLGVGNIQISGITGDAFEVEHKGSGSTILTGTVNSVNFTLSGPGSINGDQLIAKNGMVVNNGTGMITVYASDHLEAIVNGSGSIHYHGNPATIHKSVNSSGSIEE